MIKFIKKLITNYLPLNQKNYYLDLDKESYKYSYLINRPIEGLQKLNLLYVCCFKLIKQASIIN